MNKDDRVAAVGYHYDQREKERLAICNLCGADDWVTITHRDRYGFKAPTTACGTCGLTVLNPRMTPAGYADFYQHWYRPLVSAYHGRVIDAVSVQDDQKQYAEEIAGLIAPYVIGREGHSFLDVGGSTGIIALHFAKVFGLDPTVIDPAPDEIEEADKYGLKTITALMEDWDPQGQQFDVIGMFQTIDHLLDVQATLLKIRQILRPDGIFVVDIVDFRVAYLKNQSLALATKIDHPYGLTEPVMEAYLARSGFRIRRRAYSRDGHLVAYICSPSERQPDVFPDPAEVRAFFREMRLVEHAPHLAAWSKA